MALLAGVILLVWGIVRLPVEREIARAKAAAGTPEFNLALRERLGQSGFIAALGGYRALVASLMWIEAHSAWADTDWARMHFLMGNVVTLQPRAWIYWDRAAWHMAWNASVSARRDGGHRREALAARAERQFFDLGRDYLERGLANNPESWELARTLAMFLQEKMKDPCGSSAAYTRAAQQKGAPQFLRRFAAYQLSECPGSEAEAYQLLRGLYLENEGHHLPTLLTKLGELEKMLEIPPSERLIKDEQ